MVLRSIITIEKTSILRDQKACDAVKTKIQES